MTTHRQMDTALGAAELSLLLNSPSLSLTMGLPRAAAGQVRARKAPPPSLELALPPPGTLAQGRSTTVQKNLAQLAEQDRGAGLITT